MVVEKEMKHQKKEEGPRVSRLKSFADNPKMICMKSYENDFQRFFCRLVISNTGIGIL